MWGQVGSKIDKGSARAVTTEEGQALAKRYGAGFIEVSSKTRENVKKPFLDTVEKIVDNPELMNPKLTRKRKEGVVTITNAGFGGDGGGGGWGCSC